MKTCLHNLNLKIQQLVIKPLISELAIAKITGQLEGESKEERYHDFVRKYLTDIQQILEILSIYPVMARLLVEITEKHIHNHILVISRYSQDLNDISNKFPGDYSCLASITSNAGDSHCGGQSVMILNFNSGGKLVYKPRTLDIDLHFQSFISWVNKKGIKYPLSTVEVLSRENYGWQEFVENKPCKNLNEVNRFYYRQGAYIAILYLFGSTDMHYENLIAHGEHPLLIDTETLFSNKIDFPVDTAMQQISREISSSVLGSMMLPLGAFSGMENLDISALGGKGGQESTNLKVWVIDNVKTDEMCVKEIKVTTETQKNSPYLINEEVEFADDFLEEILRGFEDMYYILLDNKKELTSNSSPINKFSSEKVRHVLRATQLYSKFLDDSIHPDYLQDGLSRVRLFDYMWGATSNVKQFEKIVKSECQDLLDHDVPYFYFKVDGKSIFNSRDQEFEGFYSKSSLELIMDRCSYLSKEDYRKQKELIEMSISTLKENPFKHDTNPMHIQYDKYLEVDNKEFLKKAEEIGDYLLERLYWGNNQKDAHWFGLNIDSKDNKLSLAPMYPDLYNGTLGIILFLSTLAQETGEFKYKKAAKAALFSSNDLIEKGLDNMSVSAFYGHAAAAYVYASLGIMWNDKDLLELSFKHLDSINLKIAEDKTKDFLGGVAGAIVVATQIYKHTKNIKALEVAKKCGKELLNYLSTELKSDKKQPFLTGLSHGTAGYACSLIELWSLTKEESCLKVALELLNYEREFYSESDNNWLDLRDDVEDGATFWCHGAPGIGLARLMILNNYQDENIKKELENSIERTLESGFGFNHSLCHGDYGNLDLIISSAKIPEFKHLQHQALTLGSAIMIEASINKKWRHGLSDDIELFGLMLGISGIGYQLLRLWNRNIPSVLMLELPNK